MAKKKNLPARRLAPPRATLPVEETYRDYFLQYASYVITDRAIPGIDDGLKPVQRRILHSFWENEDGRYNKVANIVGHCMKYHPHGDASIYAAIVSLGQKKLLIDTQGNWGDPLTGDAAAATRYIEGRLSKFAKEVVFSPELTTFAKSYDGRNKEPIALPIRFPLLLAQGTEGIAVGLSTKIMPHNLRELLEAQKAHLRGETFVLYPDFPSRGSVDVGNYQDGASGSRIKVRASIERGEGKTVIIREVAFSTTTESLIESILAAGDKGKIKVAHVEDNTAAKVEVVVTFARGVDMDQAVDALYAFTDCEVSISPNAVVIKNGHPVALGVSEILIHSAERTRALLKKELQLRQERLETRWHHKSLVQIFVENRIYLRIEKSKSWESVLSEIEKGLEPHAKTLRRPLTHDDLVMLTEVKIRRISAWDSDKAKDELSAIDKELKATRGALRRITQYTIDTIDRLIETYGKDHPRKTVLASFSAVKAAQVVERSEKLYVDREAGFIGTGLKNAELLCPCSTIDDVIVILESGAMQVTRIGEKKYLGEKIIEVRVFSELERELVFNMIYEDRLTGKSWARRFTVGGVTRDKAYNLTPGAKQGRILFLSTGNESYVLVRLRKKPRIKTEYFLSFDDLLVKHRGAGGVVVNKNRISSVRRISRDAYCRQGGIDPTSLKPQNDDPSPGNGQEISKEEPDNSGPPTAKIPKRKGKSPVPRAEKRSGKGQRLLFDKETKT